MRRWTADFDVTDNATPPVQVEGGTGSRGMIHNIVSGGESVSARRHPPRIVQLRGRPTTPTIDGAVRLHRYKPGWAPGSDGQRRYGIRRPIPSTAPGAWTLLRWDESCRHPLTALDESTLPPMSRVAGTFGVDRDSTKMDTPGDMLLTTPSGQASSAPSARIDPTTTSRHAPETATIMQGGLRAALFFCSLTHSGSKHTHLPLSPSQSNHFPQAPGTRSYSFPSIAGRSLLFISLNRRARTPFAWLRASRAALSRRPGCFAARSRSGSTPRSLPRAFRATRSRETGPFFRHGRA